MNSPTLSPPTMLERPVRHLRWRDIAAGSAVHAALFAVERASGYLSTLHDHDFCEMMLVLDGTAQHPVNGVRQTLTAGMLTFLRPPDTHAVFVSSGGKLHWINIAFPLDAWQDFCSAAHLSPDWGNAAQPPVAHLSVEQLAMCATVFQATLHRYRQAVDSGGVAQLRRWELCRFLADALPFLLPMEREEMPSLLTGATDAPHWLVEACRTLERDATGLAEGLPRLQTLSGMSAGHLARTLKAVTGQTPTEFVTHLRLTRAALLLTTTALPIIQVAAECGFPNLSYFYRRFTARYRQSPSAYRREARKGIGS